MRSRNWSQSRHTSTELGRTHVHAVLHVTIASNMTTWFLSRFYGVNKERGGFRWDY
ncbi:hypothetical protein BDV26DRAFT_265880 [Aspergillus bertholletiae]|uniref:Uncharacterized protein n=1 Tax=Aspergillus bertholletiae TaxID=1226010 RepID=A0A5N7B2L6_9EURO|nr:hypothetical protein BDV26DRAFT_265880 [Aspergillus bertholletiae]